MLIKTMFSEPFSEMKIGSLDSRQTAETYDGFSNFCTGITMGMTFFSSCSYYTKKPPREERLLKAINL